MNRKVLLAMFLMFIPRLLVAHEFDLEKLTGEHWYGLYLKGQKSGHAVNSIEVDDEGSIIVTDDATFRVNMAGIKQEMRIFSKRVYAPDGSLKQISSHVDEVSGTNEFAAVVDGDQLIFRSVVGGAEKEQVLPKPNESLEDILQQVKLVQGDPDIGDEVAFSIFEPIYGQEVNGVSRIAGVETRTLDGEEVNVYKVSTKLDIMPVETISYVMENGVIYEDVVAGLIEMRLEPEAQASAGDYSHDVIVSNAAMLEEPIENPYGREELALLVEGPLTQKHLFNDERQFLTREGDHFLFRSQKVSLEETDIPDIPIENESVSRWLKPTMFIQSDDPRLKEKAQEIIGDEKNSFEAAKLLNNWVYENVDSIMTAQLSNALEVLQNLEGDCTEHSVLFIGLARAAGIPAREVAGLVYVDNGQPGFYFHQWAKIWVGKWVDIDPTFNQPLADVTHIKLAEGDLLEQSQLIPIIGKISIQPLEEAPAKEAQSG